MFSFKPAILKKKGGEGVQKMSHKEAAYRRAEAQKALEAERQGVNLPERVYQVSRDGSINVLSQTAQ
ncbi:MAG: hypothetical protein A2Z24_02290 [Candidatus Woykebacteria bacterium RBG_16_44_10]|uniref:Uncharacterized protein n=1 Tax=Candidatus Woykebacteria bacterium RBG_16_44_10 TaxID=1802597 RepID=A0A1G1WH93_9BACT|nr:MAG: hypothetical protein A2Z24_02290 [Candidatus Woykebacteria bacterium RBG_16_44_10]